MLWLLCDGPAAGASSAVSESYNSQNVNKATEFQKYRQQKSVTH